MSLQGILDQIHQAHDTNVQPQPQNNFFSGVQNIINMAKAANGDQNALMTQLAASNPKMKEAVEYVKANGGDSKAACFKLLKEKGINPDDVAKMIGK